MQRKAQVVLLCEDVEQQRFFEGLCRRLGFVSRVVRVAVAPAGTGAAEAWVRAQYPREVRAHRAKANHLTNGLITVIDGDKPGVTARRTQLDEALKEAGQKPRQPDDRIAACVPTWSIETWLAWLCGAGPVDEQTRYKMDAAFQSARRTDAITTKRAIEGWSSVPAEGEPPSLTDGRREMERLRPAG